MEHLGPMQAQGQEGLVHQGKKRLESLTGCHLVYNNTGGEKKVLVHWAPKDRISFVLPHTWYLHLSGLSPSSRSWAPFEFIMTKTIFYLSFILRAEAKCYYYVCASLAFIQHMFIKELDMYRQAKIQQWVKQGMVPAPTGACSPWGNKTIIK